MSINKTRCEEIIRAHIAVGELITSYEDFDILRDVMGESYHNTPAGAILRALTYGVEAGWLKPEWSGVGMTPYSGAAKRQRVWQVTNKSVE